LSFKIGFDFLTAPTRVLTPETADVILLSFSVVLVSVFAHGLEMIENRTIPQSSMDRIEIAI